MAEPRLTDSDLRDVLNAAYSARFKWFLLGIELGIPIGRLEIIKEESNSSDLCLVEVLKIWLLEGSASWSVLVKALREDVVGLYLLSDQIQSKHLESLVCTHSPTEKDKEETKDSKHKAVQTHQLLESEYSIIHQGVVYFKDEDFVTPPKKDLKCVNCKEISAYPMQSDCCKLTFCGPCACKISHCPTHDEKQECALNENLLADIQDLDVKCRNQAAGCDWKGKTHQLDQHLKECLHTKQVQFTSWKDDDFVNVPKVDRKCLICNEVPVKPMRSNCCDDMYCEPCTEKTPKCPKHHELQNFSLDKRLHLNNRDLRVICRNSLTGCTWKGKAHQLREHLLECSQGKLKELHYIGNSFTTHIDCHPRTVIAHDLGLTLEIPSETVPEGKTATIKCQCCIGPFTTGEGYQLASPVYHVEVSGHSLEKPIRVTVQHCADVNSEKQYSQMQFVSAPDSPDLLLPLKGGKFYESYATICLKHFCFLSTQMPSGYGRRYIAKLFCPKEPLQSSPHSVFSVSLDDPLFDKELEKSLKDDFPSESFRIQWKLVSFRDPDNKLRLMLPNDEITQLNYTVQIEDAVEPQIEKEKVDLPLSNNRYFTSPSPIYPPRVIMRISPMAQQPPTSPLECIVPLEGASGSQMEFKLSLSEIPSQASHSDTALVSRELISELNLLNLKHNLEEISTQKNYDLGLELGVPKRIIDRFQEDHPRNSEQVRTDILQYCLDNTSNLTWAKISDAVRYIGYSVLADQLKSL